MHLNLSNVVQTRGISVGESQQLKEVGLKITLPRVKVLQILEQSKARHSSAEDIYRALSDLGEDVSLATVYRVLTQFEAAGLVYRHHFEGGHSVFELSEGEHHDHLICVKCRKVFEFVDALIEERQREIAERVQFKMTDHALTIYGWCVDCQGQAKA